MSGGKEWTTKEIAIIAKYYPTGGPEECAKHLDRTIQAIIACAYRKRVGLTPEALSDYRSRHMIIAHTKRKNPQVDTSRGYVSLHR